MKLKQCIIIAAFIMFITAFFAYSQDYTRIDNSIFDNPQRPGAIFDHDTHNEKANLDDNCARCHHFYEDGKLVEDESSEDTHCSECHLLKKTNENSISLRTAYHKQCNDCHFESKKGPVLCGECHIKVRKF